MNSLSPLLLKRLQLLFGIITVVAIVTIVYNKIEAYNFRNSPLESVITDRIEQKRVALVEKIWQLYRVDMRDVPLHISDKMGNNLYGLAHLSMGGEVSVLLNKRLLKESLEYVIDEVMPHEYAHALMFKMGKITQDDGHSQEWQERCIALGGIKCERFVDRHDVVMGKLENLL